MKTTQNRSFIVENSLTTAARSISLHTGGMWAVLLASLGMLGCADVEDLTGGLALASDSHESVMHVSLATELAPISAAIASSNAQADLDLNLLARVEVQPGEMLEIYEPVPGQLLVSGVGAPAGEALLSAHAIEGLSAEEIWDLATGSTEMPGELRVAIVRASKQKETPVFNPQPDRPSSTRRRTRPSSTRCPSRPRAAAGATPDITPRAMAIAPPGTISRSA